MVTLRVEGKPVDFLVDMGATSSVLKQPQGQLQKATTKIVGATGKSQAYPWTTARITDLGKGTVTHSFLVIPDCPYPLMGRDLLQKLQATITFRKEPTVGERINEETEVSLNVTVPISEEYLMVTVHEEKTDERGEIGVLLAKIPGVWA